MKNFITFIISIFTCFAAMAQNTVSCSFTSISSNVTSNTTLSSGTLYRIEGCVHVTNGYTLTIPAGTVVMFEKSATSSLTIDEGAQLVVNGTSGSPVIFTSDQTPGHKAYGDWDGVVIEGKATNNVSGGSVSVSGYTCSSLSGGGTSDNDNSGSIEYLQIEYANHGITMLSVGSGTTMNHIQTSYIANDAFDFLGGTVDATYLASYNAKGNDFLFEYGNRSLIQFALSVRLDVSNAHLSSGSNGLVIANDASGSSNTPRTYPVISDVTFIGPLYCGATGISADYKNAVLYELNAGGGVYNSLLADWPTGMYIADAASIANANSYPATSTLNFAANAFSGNTTDYNIGATWSGSCATSFSNWLNDMGHPSCAQVGNVFGPSPIGYSSTICGTYSSTPPSFELSGSTALSYADFSDAPDLDNAFFNTSAGEYQGGFTTDGDWTASWTNWDPQDFNPCTEGKVHTAAVNNINAGNTNGLQLAPNPGKDATYAIFNTAMGGNVTISVWDNTGRLIQTTQNSLGKGAQRILVDTKGLAAGVYMVSVQTSEKIAHAQLVIE